MKPRNLTKVDCRGELLARLRKYPAEIRRNNRIKAVACAKWRLGRKTAGPDRNNWPTSLSSKYCDTGTPKIARHWRRQGPRCFISKHLLSIPKVRCKKKNNNLSRKNWRILGGSNESLDVDIRFYHQMSFNLKMSGKDIMRQIWEVIYFKRKILNEETFVMA